MSWISGLSIRTVALVFLIEQVHIVAGWVNDCTERKGFQQDCLDSHNKYRELHNVPPLKFDEEVSRILGIGEDCPDI